jgi:hypothetical protein
MSQEWASMQTFEESQKQQQKQLMSKKLNLLRVITVPYLEFENLKFSQAKTTLEF